MTANGSDRMIGEISLGSLGAADAGELERLAQRDTRAIPTGWLIGARLDGRLVAALSVPSGDWIADPFVPTRELLELLAQHAAQFRGRRARPFGRWRKRSRAGLPSSPQEWAASS